MSAQKPSRSKKAPREAEPSPLRRATASIVENASELGRTILQALVFFLIFMTILLVSFPKGSGLRTLYGEWVDRDRGKSSLSLTNPLSEEPAGSVAVLTKVTRRVKDRASGDVAWKSASRGMALEDQHAVQTLANSRAAIAFDDSRRLNLSENSLVVVQRSGRRDVNRRKRASLVVIGGRVHGTIRPGAGDSNAVEILTADAESNVESTAGGDAEYSVSVNPDDNTATLSLYSGTARVTNAGETVGVEPNQAIMITPGRAPGPMLNIPEAPRSLTPPDQATEIRGTSAPRVDFRWAPAEDADAYRFEIARDPEFVELAYETVVTDTESMYGNLEHESYWWRVVALNGPAESLPGAARQLRVVHDAEPPALDVRLPEGVVAESRLVVVGRTDPGAKVRVGSELVSVAADGSFRRTIDLRNGPNLIVIEAADAAGNVAYFSQYVNASF